MAKVYSNDNIIEKKENSSSKNLSSLNKSIEKEKKNIKKLNEINYEFVDITKKFIRCYDLLNLSIRSQKLSGEIDEYLSINSANLAKVNDIIEAETEKSKNKLNDLYYEKDHFNENERRKTNQEKEQTEKKEENK